MALYNKNNARHLNVELISVPAPINFNRYYPLRSHIVGGVPDI